MPTEIKRATVALPDALWGIEVHALTFAERHAAFMAAIEKLRQDFHDINNPDVISMLSNSRSLVLYSGPLRK